MQLDLDQPPGQQPGGGERLGVEHLHLDQPRLIRQLPGDGPQGHRGIGQVAHEVGRAHGGAPLDVGLPVVHAGVRGRHLPGPGAGQHVPHGVGVAGQVREHVRPGPPRQQRRNPQAVLGQGTSVVEQPLGSGIDLVTQLALGSVHPTTLSGPTGSMRWRARADSCGHSRDRPVCPLCRHSPTGPRPISVEIFTSTETFTRYSRQMLRLRKSFRINLLNRRRWPSCPTP